jgi:Family of unknown function (DUF6481)
MSGFKDDFNERLGAAAKAKQAMLEKFRARRPAAPAADPSEVAAEPVADGDDGAGGKASRKAGKARK